MHGCFALGGSYSKWAVRCATMLGNAKQESVLVSDC